MMNEQWEALTDEQREAITAIVQRISDYAVQVYGDIKRIAEAITDAVKGWLDSLPPDFLENLQKLVNEAWEKQKQPRRRPPRKIGTPHDGFVNMRLCCPPKLC